MSLKSEVNKLYKRGLIRDSVIKHASEQAISASRNNELLKIAMRAALTAELFGVYTPTVAKLAAAPMPVPGGIMGRLGTGAAAIGLLSGASALSQMVNRFRQARVFANTYEQMMNSNPDLRDKEPLVREHFEVLKQFAPSMASNPTVAIGYIRQAIEMGDIVPADTIHKLTQTQKQYQEGQPEGILGRALSGVAGDIKGIMMNAGELLT